MKLRLKTGIFVHFPILKTIVEYLMTRCLHFTDYPYWRGQVKNLMRAHHATLRLETDSTPPVQIESFADFVEEIRKYRNNPLAPSFRLIFP